MAHLIDKDALVAEIDKRLHQLTDAAFDSMIGRNLIEIRDFLDTLEVKEVDLDKEIDNIWNPRFNLGWDEKSLLAMNHEGFTTIAKHFFELGVLCPINNINIEEIKAAAKAWSEDDENTRGCDYIGAVVAERAFVACAEWLINKSQKVE